MSPAEPAPTLPAAASASTAPAVANAQIAELFEQVATLLAQQGASPFRVGAYRRAGQSLKRLGRDVRAIAEAEGRRGLLAIPGIGVSLASAIEEILRSGRWVQLERLRGASDPEHLFQTIAGVGPELARRIHERLHIDTLEALELAAHDGRLESVPGMGARRVAAIRSLLLSMLQRVRTVPPKPLVEPEAALLLDVDREYRELAAADRLPKIAPKRFNPAAEAWLPILHAERGAWHFTALYSNTARAHELNKTRDWVVIYFYRDNQAEGQRTIVTETHGPLLGLRVVRGREAECRVLLEGPSWTRSKTAERA